eukprot:GHVL01040939.1.p1 GENE.GHVL01040939.1~~GHVL01040939.1.p1  ORF type:complete len:367 (-),score=103.76 GHVL01040939.1:1303-2382(-)
MNRDIQQQSGCKYSIFGDAPNRGNLLNIHSMNDGLFFTERNDENDEESRANKEQQRLYSLDLGEMSPGGSSSCTTPQGVTSAFPRTPSPFYQYTSAKSMFGCIPCDGPPDSAPPGVPQSLKNEDEGGGDFENILHLMNSQQQNEQLSMLLNSMLGTHASDRSNQDQLHQQALNVAAALLSPIPTPMGHNDCPLPPLPLLPPRGPNDTSLPTLPLLPPRGVHPSPQTPTTIDYLSSRQEYNHHLWEDPILANTTNLDRHHDRVQMPSPSRTPHSCPTNNSYPTCYLPKKEKTTPQDIGRNRRSDRGNRRHDKWADSPSYSTLQGGGPQGGGPMGEQEEKAEEGRGDPRGHHLIIERQVLD